MVKGMTLQNNCETKESANTILKGFRDTGFTGRIVKTQSGSYLVYIGSFGARYRKMKRLSNK
jgi:hypothetical protein